MCNTDFYHLSHRLFQLFRSTEHGCVAFDCEQNEEVLFAISILSLPADNPMQSELASHIGMKGNCFCRCCGVGGTQQEKGSKEGFHALFSVRVIHIYPY